MSEEKKNPFKKVSFFLSQNIQKTWKCSNLAEQKDKNVAKFHDLSNKNFYLLKFRSKRSSGSNLGVKATEKKSPFCVLHFCQGEDGEEARR